MAFALRMFYAAGQSFTFDEVYEITLARASVAEILVMGDGFPPLFSIVMHYWNLLFGAQTGRVLSAMIGAVGCWAIYRLGRLVADRTAAVWMAFLLAVLPVHLFYTSELRAYSVVLLLATMGLEYAVRSIETDSYRDWRCFAVISTLGIYTHYLFVVFVGIALLVSLIYVHWQKPVACGAFITVFIIPLLIWLVPGDFQLQSEWVYGIPFGISELAFTYGTFLMGYMLGPSLRELHVLGRVDAVLYALPWATMFVVPLALITVWNWNRIRLPRPVPLFFVVALGPLIIGILSECFSVGYQVRYSIWAIVPLVVVMGIFVSSAVQESRGRVAVAVVLGLFAIAMVNRHYVDRYRNADLQRLAERLEDDHLSRKLPVVVVSGYMVQPLSYYMDASWQLEAIPMTSPFEQRFDQMSLILQRLNRDTGSFWFVYTREFHEDSDGRLKDLIGSRAELEFVCHYAGIQLYRGTFESPPTPDA